MAKSSPEHYEDSIVPRFHPGLYKDMEFFEGRDRIEHDFMRSRRGMEWFGLRRASPYIGLGLPPQLDRLLSHTVLSEAMIPAVDALISDTRFQAHGFFLIPDTLAYINVLRKRKIEGASSLYRGDFRAFLAGRGFDPNGEITLQMQQEWIKFSRIDAEVREEVRLAGADVRTKVKSILEYLIVHRHVNFRDLDVNPNVTINKLYRPVIQMTDLMLYPGLTGAEDAGEEIDRIFGSLCDIVGKEEGNDDDLVHFIWQGMPYGIKHSLLSGKAGNAYKKLNTEQRKRAQEAMGYVLMQIALVVYWGGSNVIGPTKWGHSKGEGAFFDEAVKLVVKKYARELDLDVTSSNVNFYYPDLDEKSTFPRDQYVPYRYHQYPVQGTLERPPFQTIGLLASKQEGTLVERLSEIKDKYLQIFEVYLKRLMREDYVEPGKKALRGQIMVRFEVYKLLREFISELNLSDPELRAVLEDSGINAVLMERGSVYDLSKLRMDNFPVPLSDLEQVDKNSDYVDFAGRALDRLLTLGSDAGLTCEKVVDALWGGAQQILAYDGINYGEVLKHGEIPPGEVSDFGFSPEAEEEFRTRFGGSYSALRPQVFLELLIQNFLDEISKRKAEVQYLFEHKDAYFIRYIAQVLSGPASKNQALADVLTEILVRLSRVVLPTHNLMVDLRQPSWPYDGWKAKQTQTSSQ